MYFQYYLFEKKKIKDNYKN